MQSRASAAAAQPQQLVLLARRLFLGILEYLRVGTKMALCPERWLIGWVVGRSVGRTPRYRFQQLAPRLGVVLINIAR
jgi:hypothetical protein